MQATDVITTKSGLTATLYLADCLEVLPTLGKVDAVITDPPYGIGADKGQMGRANRRDGKALAPSKDYGVSDWDSKPPDQSDLDALRRLGKVQVLWGGNHFALPPSRGWLVWDKLTGANDYADCELAWTNLDKPVRRIVHRWHGMLRDGVDGDREHPTQKPIDVMVWAIKQCGASGAILDPFMGSGTTGVAALRMGCDFIGVELEPKYYAIAKRRIQAEAAQQKLF